MEADVYRETGLPHDAKSVPEGNPAFADESTILGIEAKDMGVACVAKCHTGHGRERGG